MHAHQQYFYTPNGLAQVKCASGKVLTLIRASGRLLAQRYNDESALYVTDLQGSVLRFLGRDAGGAIAYTAYGRDVCENPALLTRFAGQRKDKVVECYHLGEGYRAYSTMLMRFLRADSLSPFRKGGINCYGYCSGDPVNSIDPTGRWKVNVAIRILGRKLSDRAAEIGLLRTNPEALNPPTVDYILSETGASKNFTVKVTSALRNATVTPEQQAALKKVSLAIQGVVDDAAEIATKTSDSGQKLYTYLVVGEYSKVGVEVLDALKKPVVSQLVAGARSS